MWHQTHTSTIQTMVEAVSVAREGTNGESSSDSVSTQECTKLHLRASTIFPKIFWGEHAPLGSATYAASRFAAGGSPTKRTTLKDFLDPPLILDLYQAHPLQLATELGKLVVQENPSVAMTCMCTDKKTPELGTALEQGCRWLTV